MAYNDYGQFDHYESDYEEQIRQRRRAERIAVARAKRRFKRRMRWVLTRIVPFCLICLMLLGGIGYGIYRGAGTIRAKLADETNVSAKADPADDTPDEVPGDADVVEETTEDVLTADAEGVEDTGETDPAQSVITFDDDMTVGGNDAALAAIDNPPYHADRTDHTGKFAPDVLAEKGILIDPDSQTIVVDQGGTDRIIPASMTKVLTLLVAAEHITNLDDTYQIPIEVGDYAHEHDLSIVGFSTDEVVTVRDLLYGTILPSGGDAAIALANYVAGSHEAFVDLMNERLVTLGLSETTHFTNCVGLYDPDHYSTCYDIAMIMEAALDNELCREILSTKRYVTKQTEFHPDGIEISNWFLRRIEDKDAGGEVVYAKTGYVKESGYCAVSFAEGGGRHLICVTLNSGSSWKCIYDHARIYKGYFDPAG